MPSICSPDGAGRADLRATLPLCRAIWPDPCGSGVADLGVRLQRQLFSSFTCSAHSAFTIGGLVVRSGDALGGCRCWRPRVAWSRGAPTVPRAAARRRPRAPGRLRRPLLALFAAPRSPVLLAHQVPWMTSCRAWPIPAAEPGGSTRRCVRDSGATELPPVVLYRSPARWRGGRSPPASSSRALAGQVRSAR